MMGFTYLKKQKLQQQTTTASPTNTAADHSPKNMPEIVKNDTPVERE